MPQLLLHRLLPYRVAQLKKPFLSRMGVSTHPTGRNGYEEAIVLSSVAEGLGSVSHTTSVEASAPVVAQAPFPLAVDIETVGVGSAAHGVVLWRFAGGAFRDGAGRLCGGTSTRPPARRNVDRLFASAGRLAAAGAARLGKRRPRPNRRAVCRCLADQRLAAHGLRRHALGMPALGGTAAAAGRGGQTRLGADGVFDRVGAAAHGPALVVALGQGHGQRTRPSPTVVADSARVHPDRRRPVLHRLLPVRSHCAGPGRVSDAHVVARLFVSDQGSSPGAFSRKTSSILAEAHARPSKATYPSTTAAYSRQEGRRLAVDQHPGPAATQPQHRGAVVSLALAQRRHVPSLQAPAEEDEVVQPQGGVGTPRGGGFAAGVAVASGDCRDRAPRLPTRTEQRRQSTPRAAGHPRRAVGIAAYAGSAAVPDVSPNAGRRARCCASTQARESSTTLASAKRT